MKIADVDFKVNDLVTLAPMFFRNHGMKPRNVGVGKIIMLQNPTSVELPRAIVEFINHPVFDNDIFRKIEMHKEPQSDIEIIIHPVYLDKFDVKKRGKK